MQSDIRKALDAHVNNDDPEPWHEVIKAIRAGQIIVTSSAHQLVLKMTPTPARAALGHRLTELRTRSGMSTSAVASAVHMSESSIHRLLHGYVVSQWPVVAMVVEVMGGDPEQFKDLHRAAREEIPA